MTELTIEQQIASAYKESEKWMQEDMRLKELEFEIAIKRREAHHKRLEADERLWVLQHKP